MRLRVLLLALPIVALPLAGCGDKKDTSAEAKNYCSVAAPIRNLGTALESEDSNQIKAAFTAAETALGQVGSSVPAAISAQVTTIKATFTTVNDALKKSNYNLKTAVQDKAVNTAVGDLEGPAFGQAADAIQQWTTKNC